LLYGLKDSSDNAAHIGGLMAGLVLGFSWLSFEKKYSPFAKIFAIVLPILFPIAGGILLHSKSQEMALIMHERSEYREIRSAVLIECKKLLSEYPEIISTPRPVEDRYGLSNRHMKAFQQLKNQLGTFRVKYLSESERLDLQRITLFVEKNYEYCSVYKTLISPGGENLHSQFKSLKVQIDSLNYSIFR
jgi:hypothetical protein